MHHISIVIVNYNSSDLTTACLKSLEKVQVKNARFEIIVVDNGSKDLYEAPKSLHNKVVVLRSESNQGFTGGNNIGIHHAVERLNTDFVLLLNNDTHVTTSFLQSLYDFLIERDQYGMVCPQILFSTGKEFHAQSYLPEQIGKVLWYAGGSIDWQHLTAFHRGVDEVDRKQFVKQDESEFCTGCCVLIKREVLEKIGFLDTDYFLYFEDVDLSVKAKRFGYKIGYCDTDHIWHENAGSSNGPGSPIHTYYQTRNRLQFFWSYGNWRVKTTVGRLVSRYLRSSNSIERTAALHFLLGQKGKQPIV